MRICKTTTGSPATRQIKDGLPRWVMDICGPKKLDEMTEEQCEQQTQAMIRNLMFTCQNLKQLDVTEDTHYTIKLKLYLGECNNLSFHVEFSSSPSFY